MTWISVSLALPAMGERVLISTPRRIEIATRTSPDARQLEGPAFLWEIEGEPAHYEPRAITHWMPLPSRP